MGRPRDEQAQAWATQTIPQWQQTPPVRFPQSFKPDVYANRVEVERHEHDAVLRFYRDGQSSAKQVGEVTVPLGVLESMKEVS